MVVRPSAATTATAQATRTTGTTNAPLADPGSRPPVGYGVLVRNDAGRSPVELLRPDGTFVSQCSLQVRANEVRPLQVRVAEVRPLQVRAVEVRPLQVRTNEVRPLQVRAAEVRPLQVHVEEVRPLQVRAAEVRPLQVRAPEVRVPQVDRMQVELIDRIWRIWAEWIAVALRRRRKAATAKHGQARLHIRGLHLQLGHLVDWCGGDVLAGPAWWPGGVAADERGE